MLFTINDSTFSSKSLDSLMRVIPEGAPILFYEDGVYNVKVGSQGEKKIMAIRENHAFYAIDADIEARGLKKVAEVVKVIGYEGFVELVEKHDVIPWL